MKLKSFVTMGLAMVGLLCSQFVMADDVVDYLHCWKLNGDANDSVSAAPVDGAVSGGVEFVGDKGIDGAVAISGDDAKISFGTGASMSGKVDFTVSVWFKTAKVAQTVVQQRGNGYKGEYFVWIDVKGKLVFNLYGKATSSGNCGYQFKLKSELPVNDDVWHNVTAVRGNGAADAQLYVDGVLVDEVSGTTPRDLSSTLTTCMGRDVLDGKRQFNGLMDEFRIYDRALSSDEVAGVYAAYLGRDVVAPSVNPLVTENLGWVVCIEPKVSENLDVVEFVVKRDGVVVKTFDRAPLTFRDSTVSPNTAYVYTFEARDRSGNQMTPVEVALTTGSEVFPGVSGKVVLEEWFDSIKSVYVDNSVRKNVRYPEFPYTGGYLTSTDLPRVDTDYGTGYRVSGWIRPTVTGDYLFSLSSLGNSKLYLSGDDLSSSASLIAEVKGAYASTEYLQVDKYSTQRSGSIHLVAGGVYFFQVLESCRKGNNHLSVQWESENAGVTRQLIPGENLLAPQNLATPPAPAVVTAQDVSDRLVRLTWSDVADDVCLKKYLIYRDGALIGETLGFGVYVDTAVNESTTYSYTVVAQDVDGGQGVPSAALVVDTPAAPAAGSGVGLAAKYYSGVTDFSGTPINRIDPVVDFDWGLGSPDPAVGDVFCTVWSGTIEALYSANHVFTVRCDDGVRLYIDGKPVIRDWSDHWVKDVYSKPIALEAGRKYDVRLEYHDAKRSAVAKLYWESNLHPREIVPQSQLYPDLWAHGSSIAIITPESSVVSPAFVEGRNGADADSVTITGTDAPIKRFQLNKFYVNVPLKASGDATVLTFSTDDESVTHSLTWTPTDLSVTNASTDSIVIREGDSLLFDGSSGLAGEEVAIDVDSDGTADYVGVVGDRFPHLYESSGEYVATLSVNGVLTGSLKVIVVGVDFDGDIACEVRFRRIKDIKLKGLPPTAFETISADWSGLIVGFNKYLSDGVRVTLQPSRLGAPDILVRLKNGPIVAAHVVDTFIYSTTAFSKLCMIDSFEDGSFMVGAHLTIRPKIENLTAKVRVIVSGVTMADSTSKLLVNTSKFRWVDYLNVDAYYYQLLIQPGVKTGDCHEISIFQNGVRVGQ